MGDDVNPCSRTAPCKTFAGAISKTFINGEIDALDPAGYGTINITKSITIDGTATLASILASGTTGVIVNIAGGNANDPQRTVRLRGLSIYGGGASGTVGTRTGVNGINFVSGLHVFVEDCVISDFTNNGINFAASADSPNLYVRNTVIRNCSGDGINVSNSAAGQTSKASLNTTHLLNCTNGLASRDRSRVVARDCVFSNNTSNGVVVISAINDAVAMVEDSSITHNTTGIGTANTTSIRINNDVITNNGTGVSSPAGQVRSFGHNMIKGNITIDVSGVLSSDSEQ
ncbi:MAG TPA: hypothetical protein VF525_15650 [Pyrinomonadaceae bacterium]